MLPAVQGLNLEILLVLGSSTQPEGFGIGNKAIIAAQTFYIGNAGSFGQDKARKSNSREGRLDDNISVLGVKLFFAAIVSKFLWYDATQSQVTK